MAANSPCGSVDLEELRGEVRKVLDSATFAGAKQLQAFLAYGSEAVFQGRSAIDQTEIAREVLGRGEDFNPLDDPSVRKMASLLRQRLQRYYETDGAQDRVFISLPLRSYLPQFQLRDEPDGAVPPEPVEVEEVPSASPAPVAIAAPAHRRRWLRGVLAIVLLALGVAAGYFARRMVSKDTPAGEFHLWTKRGTINSSADLNTAGVFVGPEVREHDEVVVRMRFRPTQPMHQAGLVIFGDSQNYVEFGRIFEGRGFVQFAAHLEDRYQKSGAQILYDPEAGTLAPVWLAIRRNGNEYRAFRSPDGVEWKPFGEPRQLPKPLMHPRVGLYAFHGKVSTQPVEAVFDHLSVGPGLHDWPQDASVDSIFADWQKDRGCPAVNSLVVDGPGIRFNGLSPERRCTAEIVRPVPSGDWTISTRIDFVPMHGLLSGLQVRGSRGRFRVVRWNINGGTITAELVHGEQAHAPDFAGNPPLILRITCRNGVLQASFSRDDVEYVDLPLRVPLASLGNSPVIGYQLGNIRWLPGDAPPPLVYWVHQEVTEIHALPSSVRN